MTDYKVLYTDLKSGNILGELPTTGLSIKDALNVPGSFSGSVPIDDTGLVRLPPKVIYTDIEQDAIRILADASVAIVANRHDGNTTAVVDVTGNGHDAVFPGGTSDPSFTAPVIGSHGYFSADGVNDYLSISPVDAMQGLTGSVGELTVLTLLRTDFSAATGLDRIWGNVDAGIKGFRSYVTTSIVNVSAADGSFSNSSKPHSGIIANDEWAVVGLRLNNGSLNTWLNDIESFTTNSTARGSLDSAHDLHIFRDGLIGGYINADISAFLVFDRALTDDEIATMADTMRDSDVWARVSPVIGGAVPEFGTISIDVPQQVTLETVAPGRTGIYLLRDSVVLWGGIVWAVQVDAASSTLSISAEGFLSYLRRLHISDSLDFILEDQGVIAKDLVDYATSKPGVSIDIVAPTPATSKPRTRHYPGFEYKSIGEAIEQLAAVNLGFSFRFISSLNAGEDGFDTTFVIDTDPIGRLTNYVFELGVNASVMALSLDGNKLTNHAVVVGASVGDNQTKGTSYNSSALTEYPLLESVRTRTDVKTVPTLTSEAIKDTNIGATALERLTLGTFANSIPGIGSYVVGDRVTVRGSYGALQISGVYRITEIGLAVSSSGEESISLSLVPQGVF